MIRVNLIGGERDRAGTRGGIDLVQRVTIACSAILVVTAVVIGWQFWSLRQQSNHVTEELAAANAELERLAPVLERVRTFDTQRAQLAERVALIEELRRGQSGPVHMLDEISQSLPDGLWLLELRQDASMVGLRGRSTTLTALSDFVANLEESGAVVPPVEIVDSQLEDTPQGDLVRFELRATFVSPS